MIQPVIFKSKVVLVEMSSYRAPSLQPLILGSSNDSRKFEMQSWRGEPYDGSALSKGPDRKSEDRTVMTEPISGVGSILAINGGSSTLKFALFRVGVTPVRELSGSIDRMGSPEGTITWAREGTGTVERRTLKVPDHVASIEPPLACIKDRMWTI